MVDGSKESPNQNERTTLELVLSSLVLYLRASYVEKPWVGRIQAAKSRETSPQMNAEISSARPAGVAL